jgi:hypothetical protein
MFVSSLSLLHRVVVVIPYRDGDEEASTRILAFQHQRRRKGRDVYWMKGGEPCLISSVTAVSIGSGMYQDNVFDDDESEGGSGSSGSDQRSSIPTLARPLPFLFLTRQQGFPSLPWQHFNNTHTHTDRRVYSPSFPFSSHPA